MHVEFFFPDFPETTRPSRQRRKRKSSSTPNASTPTSSGNSSSKKKSPSTTSNFPLASQDVMVVGEPSLMGGEFGDEDERFITR